MIQVGDVVRLEATLVVNGTPTDPTSLRIEITDPSSNVTTYVYGTDPELVRSGTGEYYVDLTIDEAGTWTYEWYSNNNLTAFHRDTIVTAQTFTFLVTDDQSPSVPVPYAEVLVRDADTNHVTTIQSDVNGEGSFTVNSGTYSLSGTKCGWRIPEVKVDLTLPGVAPDVTLSAYELTNGWLKIEDLETVTSVSEVDRLFSDQNIGTRNNDLIVRIIDEAEGLASSKLLRSWTAEQISNLAFHDPSVRSNAAWIAIELACERRKEFIASDGKGRYWTQYERAMKFFDDLSKSKDHSLGESAQTKLGRSAAGKGKNSGGRRMPRSQANNWIFSDEADGRRHGGF